MGETVQLVNRHLGKGGLKLRIVAEKLTVGRITCTTPRPSGHALSTQQLLAVIVWLAGFLL